MKIIVTVDNRNGILFGNRRQSRDSVLIQDVLDLSQGKLKIAPFSSVLFPEVTPDPDFLDHAEKDDWCFVEDRPLQPWKEQIDQMAVYCWNRDYPATVYLDLDPGKEGWTLLEEKEFSGTSHPRITRRVYQRNK